MWQSGRRGTVADMADQATQAGQATPEPTMPAQSRHAAPGAALPSVLFVHGIRTSATMWRAQRAHLEAIGVRADAVDLPGHGRSMEQEFTVQRCRQAIEVACQALPAGPRIIVGLSLGGYLALDWAARTPSRVDAVLAAGCSVRPRGPALAGYRRLAGLIGRLPDKGRALNDAVARRMLRGDAVRDISAGGVAVDVMSPALAAIGGVDPLADLRRIQAPVWIVNGAWDHFRIEQRRFWDAVNTGRLIVVPRAGHMVSLEQPQVFNDILTTLVHEVHTSRG